MRLSWLGFGVLVTAAACVGDDPAGDPGALSSSGAASSSSSSGSTSGGSSSGADACLAARCEERELVQCSGERVRCPLGCRTDGSGARCAVFDPQGPATPQDLLRSDLGDLVLSASLVVDVRTGEIRNTTGVSPRQPNDDPARDQVKNNVAFRVENGVAIFVAKNIVFEGAVSFGGTEGGNVGPAYATLPVAFVAQDQLRVHTLLRLPCGALGGGRGGAVGREDGRGGGAGGAPSNALNGGGGGHGSQGALGGTSRKNSMPVGGATGGDAHNQTFTLIGGGGGGAGESATKGSVGGGGGGAIALIAGNQLWIGNGQEPQGINAGGCGGTPFLNNGVNGISFAGGGGGAGGFIALEAPVIRAAQKSGLAANGGGGSGYDADGPHPGQAGLFSSTPALGGGVGGIPAVCDAAGGNGAAGGPPDTAPSGNLTCPEARGGGGGGGLGRIAIGSLTGQVEVEDGAIPFFSAPASGPQFSSARITAEP